MYGLVLEGGGARGAYQIGAWKAIKELGIEIKGVAGTSVGALNGAMIVQEDFDRTYELWYNITPSKVTNLDDILMEKIKKIDITTDNIRYLLKHLKILVGDMGIDITPLKQLLREHIDEKKIRNSNKDFGIVTISLTEMKPLELYIEDIQEGQLINYLIASSSLPVFKLERLEGKLFLDGGFYNNLPANLLISKGYKDLIIVKLNSMGRVPRICEEGLNITYIEPKEDLGRALDFSQDKARRNIELGYFDTLRVFRKLKGSKYYIEMEKDKDLFRDYLMNLDESTVLKIGEILGIEGNIPYRRMLFERIIPRITELLGIDKNSSYEDIIVALYEKAAENSNIERFKIYTFEDFKDIVIRNFQSNKDEYYKRIPKVLKQRDLIIKTFKREILNRVIDELFKVNKS